MKRITFYPLFLLFILAIIVLIACNKESLEILPYDDAEITFRDTLVEFNESNYDNFVATTVIGLMNLAGNSTFRQTVYDMASEQFDGDDNVLLRLLSDELNSEGINLKSSMTSALNTYGVSVIVSMQDEGARYENLDLNDSSAELDELIEGFDYFNEKGFIQIYVPNLATLNKSKKPVIALGLEDEDETIGLIPNIAGVYSVGTVTESLTALYPVWVISVNESFDTEEALEDFLGGDTLIIRGPEGFEYKESRLDSVYKTKMKAGSMVEVIWILLACKSVIVILPM